MSKQDLSSGQNVRWQAGKQLGKLTDERKRLTKNVNPNHVLGHKSVHDSVANLCLSDKNITSHICLTIMETYTIV